MDQLCGETVNKNVDVEILGILMLTRYIVTMMTFN